MYVGDKQGKTQLDEEICMMGCMECCGNCCECANNQLIREGSVGLVTKFGKFAKIVGAGAQSYNCCTEKVQVLTIMIQVLNLPVQRVLTKDGLHLSIKAFVKYQIIHPQLYKFNHCAPDALLSFTVLGALRSVIGRLTLSENLLNQVDVKKKIANMVKHKVEEYGLVVYDVEIERMVMDVNMQRALAIAAEAERKAKAKVQKSRACLDSSKATRMAADELSKNSLSIQLKYFETLRQIGNGHSTVLLRDTIVAELQKKNLRK